MASLIQGYEYDIFISYRQNDNKYDGWVTAFVHNLTIELEATIKDKVSVFFDIDPQDGLLETHSVNRSLEDKLRCLIFIPIISRTYCDKNAFAWHNEFCAFNKLAGEDKFGRDIRLGRGNFASRILPIKIHQLDPEDKRLLENELGGSLRSIDFIYKSAGVNRPLRDHEDYPHHNLNNTYYRDQINKVANAIAEIISVLKCESAFKVEKEIPNVADNLKGVGKDENKAIPKKTLFSTGNKIWVIFIGLIAILAIILKLIYPTVFNKTTIKESGITGDRISVAVMPFHNLTNDSTLNYLRLGVQDGIVTSLSFYPESFNIRSYELLRNFLKNESISYLSSITPYVGSNISKKLNADVFILGDIHKSGRIIRLNAQLIDSKTEEIIRSFQAEGVSESIMYTIDSLAEMVRNYLIVSKIDNEAFQPKPDNPNKINYITHSPEAYRYHFLALDAFYGFDYNTAIKMDSQAVAIDSNFVDAIITLCWENYSDGNYEKATKWLLKAYKKRDEIPLIQRFRLDYQYACFFQTPNEQIKCLRQLQKIDDNNPVYFRALGYQYVNLCRYDEALPEFEKAQEIYKRWGSEPNDIYYYQFLIKAYHKTGQNRKVREVLQKAEKALIKNNPGSKTGDQYLTMAVINSNAGLNDMAEFYFKKAISLDPGNPNILFMYATSLIENDFNLSRGLELINAALELNPDNGTYLDTKGWGLYRQHKYHESLQLLEKAYQMIPSFEIKAHIDSVKAAIIKQN
jgi:tetratricopeptide (TPR) repeat protein